MNEHKANIRNLSNNSKLVEHILQEKHKFDFSNVQTLALESNWRRRVIKESILTNRMLGNSINVEAWSCAILTPQMSEVLLADVNHFMNYLKRICSFILDSSLNSIDIDQLFIDELFYNSIQRFISHDQCQALFISKKHSTTEYSSSLSSSLFNLCAISNEDCQINSNHLSLILLKRNLTILNDISYHKQLQIIYLLDSNQQKVLFGASSDQPCIDLPDIILPTAATDDQTNKKLIGSIIQTSTNSKNQGISFFDESSTVNARRQ
jgi:hypothetical protein